MFYNCLWFPNFRHELAMKSNIDECLEPSFVVRRCVSHASSALTEPFSEPSFTVTTAAPSFGGSTDFRRDAMLITMLASRSCTATSLSWAWSVLVPS